MPGQCWALGLIPRTEEEEEEERVKELRLGGDSSCPKEAAIFYTQVPKDEGSN